MQPDNELLRQYATAKSEAAFAELVKRHVNLVYSAALRQVGGDAHLAHDVAQTVFTDLARKAGSLSKRETLTGWLYTSACFAAGKMARTEIRRREREEQFMRDPAHTSSDADWEKLRPILDAAMHGLKESDREAVLLRYFENRPYAEVGAKLGINENTARMRVERALEKLRSSLAKRGLTAVAGLTSVISANAIQVAPPALAATLANTAFAAGTGTSFALLKFMTLTQLKVGLGAIVVAGVATTMVLQHQTLRHSRADNESLRQQIAQLKTENEEFSNRLNSTRDSQSLSTEQLNELLRLRAQVGDLTRQVAEAAKASPQNAAATTPGATNDAATEERQMLGHRLDTAHRLAAAAMMGFAEHHHGQFPTNWNQLKDDFDTIERKGLSPGDPMPDTEADFNWASNEYEFVYQGSVTNLYNAINFSDIIVFRQKQPFHRMDGKQVKTYGFADGHGQLMAEPPEGFEAWENQRLAPPPTN